MRLAVVALLAACAAAPSNPVPVAQPRDASMACPAIAAERERNRAEALRLAGTDGRTRDGNVAKGVVGAVVFWPAIFALDLSQSAQIELRALQDRDARLAWLAAERGCSSDGEDGAAPGAAPGAAAGGSATGAPARASANGVSRGASGGAARSSAATGGAATGGVVTGGGATGGAGTGGGATGG
ncbi:MAG: hypothetical protein AAF677_14980 [Pseudomonadota bacterium]